MDAVTSNELLVRFITFGAVLGAMAVWELVSPRRTQVLGRRIRWPGNLGVVVLDTLLVRLIFPMGAVGVALAASPANTPKIEAQNGYTCDGVGA